MTIQRFDQKLVHRAWQRMRSGHRLDILDPSPLEIEIDDIALGLSREARWNGQTRGEHAYSVAQHSILVTELMASDVPDLPTEALLAGFLHDAPEYVTSDLVTPFKKHIGSVYRTIEDRVARAVRVAFNLPAELPQEWAEAIDRADHAAAYLEAVHLAGFSEQEARTLFDFRRRAPIIDIEPWEARVAKDRFLAVFDDLVAGGHGCRTIWAGQPLWAVPELQLVEARSA
ncbi:putative hydrolases of HD superfamily [Paramagnetospirillum magnetotacticum MS-1]|jgi:5'-deoxynucleotidase YfbR-like HD superfamily hydrolase|uniref:Putative hydrolases of HD superfamily n=1 Tax=Paramagnetospirillum magnetotacticum MS-1 TaxID=272627 RepID=A0A0C2UV67_PARME|nr:YfbR-like 5'-deoxynucleotidase [Paramagnetospirillum magnetotacticum]KIL96721.1 putative hydrolases of HD superfamily [Paramagnetospirillum magnetotacticum MS-1]